MSIIPCYPKRHVRSPAPNQSYFYPHRSYESGRPTTWKPLSESLLLSSLILGTITLTDFYLNRAQGYLLPESMRNPDYKIETIKRLLDPKYREDKEDLVFLNGKYAVRKNFTHQDYLSKKLELGPWDIITRHFAFLPIKTNQGFTFFRPYYKYSTRQSKDRIIGTQELMDLILKLKVQAIKGKKVKIETQNQRILNLCPEGESIVSNLWNKSAFWNSRYIKIDILLY